MDKIKDIIVTWIAMKGLLNVSKIIGAIVFALMLFLAEGIPAKIVIILCFIGFFRCIL